MRIISGQYKGSNIIGYDIKGTRPTMDRVKESLFAMIQNNIKNSICLDLFAGSGNLGLEALSNYAAKCYFVDNNYDIVQVLKQNINKIKIKEEYVLIDDDAFKALKLFKDNNLKFDLIFLDPPYELNLINKSLDLINEYDLLSKDGLIVCEFESEIVTLDNYEIIKQKKYGTKNIYIIKKH